MGGSARHARRDLYAELDERMQPSLRKELVVRGFDVPAMEAELEHFGVFRSRSKQGVFPDIFSAAGPGTGSLDPNVFQPSPSKLVTIRTAALGGSHTCAVTTDGALWCWGDNTKGQLGIGTVGDAPVPVPTRVAFPCTG